MQTECSSASLQEPVTWLILSQMSLVHENHYHSWISILIISSLLSLGLVNHSFTQMFATKPLYAPILLSSACYMPDASSSWPYDSNNICWGVQPMKLLTMQSSPVSPYVLALNPPKSFSTPCFHPLLYSFLCARDRVSHSYKKYLIKYCIVYFQNMVL